MESHKKVGVDLGLTDDEKALLKKIARKTIEAKLKGGKIPECTPQTDTLKELRGGFVSLHLKGNLRGCIGSVHATKPLYMTVHDMANAAAFNDPRFEPLQESELDELEIEISVLTPMKDIKDMNEIEIGKHGLMITKDFFSGLLLPQVATKYGWDRKTFLEQTCLKAGLAKGAWKEPDTVIKVFSADVF